MLRALGGLLALSLVLTACDTDPSVTYTPPPVLLPLAVGNAWTTDYTWDYADEDRPDRTGTDTIQVVASVDVDGETWYEVRNQSQAGFPDGVYTNRRDGVYRADIRTPLAELPDSVSIPDGAYLVYKFPAQVGDTYDVYGGIQVTVVATNAPVTLPFGTFEAVVYEFRPTEAWFDAQPGEPVGFEEGAGLHYAYFVPDLGYADFQIAWVSTTGGTQDAPLWETLALSSWTLNAPPTLLDADTPSAVRSSAAASSARPHAQRLGGLGAEAGLLVGREGAPVAVGEGAVERPE